VLPNSAALEIDMETKMNSTPEIRQAQGDLMGAFEAFRHANDQRLAEIEKKATADVLLEEKVDRIDAAVSRAQASLDRITLSGLRPGASMSEAGGSDEVKAAWSGFMRRGDEAGLARIEAKSLSVGVAGDGGHVAPPEVMATIDRRMYLSSPMRKIATVRQTLASSFRKPIATSVPAVGWVAENGVRTETATPSIDLLTFPMGELYAMAAATQFILDDALLDIDQWLAGEIAESFAMAEGVAFINGDGVNKPKGMLNYTIAADGTATWGQLGYVATGVAGGFAGTNPIDKLVDLTYAPKTPYRANSSFLMNRRTVAQVRKFKDSTGQYIWQPSLVAGQPATLLGFPMYEAEDMPDVAANAHAIAFGDFAKGYLIVDRADVRVLRDPYSSKPFVMFYVTKRVGGGVQDFDAIKLLKFAVS
jgi:HK97 family phage major capsid protein